jgi:C1A family cysteine protease
MPVKGYYGWRPSLPDFRDYMYPGVVSPVALPKSVDLRTTGFFPSVYDQGHLGSCTANSIAAAVDFDLKKQGKPWIGPSRLYIYYYERLLEGTVPFDSGASIRDSVRVLNSFGVPPENTWPYDISKFTNQPTPTIVTSALKTKAVSYQSVSRSRIKNALFDGHPVLIGFTVYDSFESDSVASNGIVPMPSLQESVVGGHAVSIVGYDDDKQWYVCRNSWGLDWGDKGYFYLPYAYITNYRLSSDFWVVTTIGS